MRKTKIVCTIGPACEDEATLSQMFEAGMDVARLNFSHGTHAEHKKKIELIKRIREKYHKPLAIMLDTKGPEYRIGIFEDCKTNLECGSEFVFSTDDIIGNRERVSVSYKNLNHELKPDDRILVNNGLLEFTVKRICGNDIFCNVDVGGTISDRKSMSFPDKVLKQDYLSEQDKADLLFGIENGIDYVACSFVSSKQDVMDVIDFLKSNGADHINIIAKIENRSGIDNIEDICSVCDGIMIGRGDMGVELPFEELPSIQKKLITKCRLLGKRVITATEMLESMIYNTRPTRAETSDVANAVYDGTSALMLSGETAAGMHPVLTVKTMAKIAEKTENSIDYIERFRNNDFRIKNEMDAISHSVCGMAMDIGAKAIVVCSISGMTARMVSRFRPPVDIIGLSVNEKTWHQLSLSWGVKPVMCDLYPSVEVLFYAAKQFAIQELSLVPGDRIIITGGTSGNSGETNTIRVETI